MLALLSAMSLRLLSACALLFQPDALLISTYTNSFSELNLALLSPSLFIFLIQYTFQSDQKETTAGWCTSFISNTIYTFKQMFTSG